DRVGFFGFFEAREDQEAVNGLVAAASDWLRARSLDTIRGPMNPSTNHECGLLVDGFESHPVIMTTWNPRYYSSLLEGTGLLKAKDLLAYWISLVGERSFELPEQYRVHAQRALRGKSLV